MCEHEKRREVPRFRLCRYLIMNIALQMRSPAVSDYYSETKCIWCDGCGNYGIWTAVKYALVELNLHPWQVCLCYDVGCNGNGSDKIEGYRFHGLHGRVHSVCSGREACKHESSCHRLRRRWRDFLGRYRAFDPWREEQLSHHVRPAQQYKLRANDRTGEFAHATGPAHEYKSQRDSRAHVGEHGSGLSRQFNL